MDIASHTLEGEIADQHERLASALETLPALFRNVHWPAGVMGDPPSGMAAPTGLSPESASVLLVRARTDPSEAHTALADALDFLDRTPSGLAQACRAADRQGQQ